MSHGITRNARSLPPIAGTISSHVHFTLLHELFITFWDSVWKFSRLEKKSLLRTFPVISWKYSALLRQFVWTVSCHRMKPLLHFTLLHETIHTFWESALAVSCHVKNFFLHFTLLHEISYTFWESALAGPCYGQKFLLHFTLLHEIVSTFWESALTGSSHGRNPSYISRYCMKLFIPFKKVH
jgi:hypothetical protein